MRGLTHLVLIFLVLFGSCLRAGELKGGELKEGEYRFLNYSLYNNHITCLSLSLVSSSRGGEYIVNFKAHAGEQRSMVEFRCSPEARGARKHYICNPDEADGFLLYPRNDSGIKIEFISLLLTSPKQDVPIDDKFELTHPSHTSENPPEHSIMGGLTAFPGKCE